QLRVSEAATELRFESAGRIKAVVDRVSQLGKGPYRHVAPLRDFRYLSLQHGPRQGTAKAFVVTPGAIEAVGALIPEPLHPAELLRLALEHAAGQRVERLDEV